MAGAASDSPANRASCGPVQRPEFGLSHPQSKNLGSACVVSAGRDARLHGRRDACRYTRATVVLRPNMSKSNGGRKGRPTATRTINAGGGKPEGRDYGTTDHGTTPAENPYSSAWSRSSKTYPYHEFGVGATGGGRFQFSLFRGLVLLRTPQLEPQDGRG